MKRLLETGKDLGVRPVGGRSLLSLRVEKGYGSWGREYSPEYWPQEVGLDRLIKLDKPEFLGRDAYLALKDKAPRERWWSLKLKRPTMPMPLAVSRSSIWKASPLAAFHPAPMAIRSENPLRSGFVKTAHCKPGNSSTSRSSASTTRQRCWKQHRLIPRVQD